MFTAVFSILFFHAAPFVWTESSLVNIFPDTIPVRTSTPEIRLYAARGEKESFQVCARFPEAMDGLTIDTEPVGTDIRSPSVFRVGYITVNSPSRRAYTPKTTLPDPLLELAPIHAEPDTTVAFWVTYDIPPDAQPGMRKNALTVVTANGRKYTVSVTLEIFDFQLPCEPSLPVRVVLDRSVMEAFYGIEKDDLQMWSPIYQVVLARRLTPTITQMRTRFFPVSREGKANTNLFKQHLDHLLTQQPSMAILLSDGFKGFSFFPQPKDPLRQDPLQLYLHDMHVWLEERGVLKNAFVIPYDIQDRSHWQDVREAYFRVRRADPTIRRLLVGPPHPFFERYTELWAMPLRCFHPISWGRWKKGMSLAAQVPFEAVHVAASSRGACAETLGCTTVPEDAYDGSVFTAWVSNVAPEPQKPQWLEVHLEDLVQTDRLSIGWLAGKEAESIRVKTSVDGTVFGDAATTWQHFLPTRRYDADWSEASFKMTKTFRAIRFEFLSSRHHGPIGVTEVEFGVAPDAESIARIDPISCWLTLLPDDFPSMVPDAHPVETRLIPWVCHTVDAEGLLLGMANHWPLRWIDVLPQPPQVWDAETDMTGTLFYPGATGMLPSIRAERLRDGLEDYEYFQLIPRDKQGRVSGDFKVAYSDRSDGNFARSRPKRDGLIPSRSFSPEELPESLEKVAVEIQSTRVALGRALSKAGVSRGR